MATQPQPQRRRPDYANLLSEFLVDVPPPIPGAPATPAATAHYEGWESHHGQSQRFYITGFGWLNRACAINDISFLCEFKDRVSEMFVGTDWIQFVAKWEEGLACKQIRRAKKFQPVFFHKAVLILATAELALADRLAARKTDASIASQLDVYDNMKIKPAVWNINELNDDHIKALGPKALRVLADAAGQNVDVLEDLAKGHTVTRATAERIKHTNDDLFPDNPLGRVRPWPGRTRLGQLSASPNEVLSLI